jgi:hypothetical protein
MQSRSNHPISEQEIERIRLERMKKQAFLEKIQKELKDKERANLLKKKVAAKEALSNVEDLLKNETEDDDESNAGPIKKKNT